MRKKRWFCLAALLLLLGLVAGCCDHPEIFQKVQGSLQAVQTYYGALTQQDLSQDEGLQRAVVAADSALLLAGELQQQWCPDPGKAQQLDLQVSEAQKLAQEAGVSDAAPKEQGN
jgi:hypothetical protein